MNTDTLLYIILNGGLLYIIVDTVRHSFRPQRHILIWKHVGCFYSWKRISLWKLLCAFVCLPLAFGYLFWLTLLAPVVIVICAISRGLHLLRRKIKKWKKKNNKPDAAITVQ